MVDGVRRQVIEYVPRSGWRQGHVDILTLVGVVVVQLVAVDRDDVTGRPQVDHFRRVPRDQDRVRRRRFTAEISWRLGDLMKTKNVE